MILPHSGIVVVVNNCGKEVLVNVCLVWFPILAFTIKSRSHMIEL